MPITRWMPLLALLVLLPTRAEAQGPLYEYFDAHPTAAGDADSPWCTQPGLHFHPYALDVDQEPVYFVDGVYYYVGDSVVTGAPLEAVWYWDAHPIGHLGGAWCVLDGPHAHYWRPWWRWAGYSSGLWSTYDGYWVYRGPYDDWYAWSYGTYYERQWRIHVYLQDHPRYVGSYGSPRHPGVVYRSDRYVRPSWSRSSDADRYRGSWRYQEGRIPVQRYESRPRTVPERSTSPPEERRRTEPVRTERAPSDRTRDERTPSSRDSGSRRR